MAGLECDPINLTYTADKCYGIAGLNKFWIGSFKDGISYTTGTNSIITGFSGGTVSFYEVQQDLKDGFMDDQAEFDDTTLGKRHVPTVTMKFHDMKSALREILHQYESARVQIIGLDNRGRYWLAGKEGGLRATENSIQFGNSGTTEMNGATLTFQGSEKEIFQEIDETTFLNSFNTTSA